jgi:peroxiredoxin
MDASLLKPGDEAHAFNLVDAATGQSRSLSSYRGERSVVLLFYRGPWCGVCHQHLGQVRKRYDDVKERGGEVLAIYPGTAEMLRPYVEKRKLPFPLLVDPTGETIDRYGVRNRWALIHKGIPHPSTYIIDREGVVRFADVRFQHYFRVPVNALVAELEKLQPQAAARS